MPCVGAGGVSETKKGGAPLPLLSRLKIFQQRRRDYGTTTRPPPPPAPNFNRRRRPNPCFMSELVYICVLFFPSSSSSSAPAAAAAALLYPLYIANTPIGPMQCCSRPYPIWCLSAFRYSWTRFLSRYGRSTGAPFVPSAAPCWFLTCLGGRKHVKHGRGERRGGGLE
jgi:hypothetical protein